MSKSEAFKNISLGCMGFCVIFLIAGLLLTGLAVVGGITANLLQDQSESTSSAKSKYDPASLKEEYLGGIRHYSGKTPKIAVIRVRGVMVSNAEKSLGDVCDSRAVCLQIRRASQDPAVKAMILELDTPGGEVAAADEIYHELMLLRQQSKKPLIGMMNSLCASGGYYIVSACNAIVAQPSTLTGSIGVIISTFNYSGLFSKLGVKSENYTSGKMKDMLNGGRARTDEEVRIVQSLIECSYSDFVRIVSRSRKIPEEKIRKGPVGDGRIFSGKQALKLGLVDKLGYFRDAAALAAKEAGMKDKYTLITYEETFDFSKVINMLLSRSAQPMRFSLQGQMNSNFTPRAGVLYYLPPSM